jgi:putative SOS response-associated peptidase YedK
MILSVEDERKWLESEQSVEDLKKMLQPFPVEQMMAYPVNKAVGSVKNQGAELVEEIK